MSIFPSAFPTFAPRRFTGLEVHGRMILGGMEGGREWEIMAPMSVTWIEDGVEQSIELVVGGITDLASIPPLVHSIMRKLGKHNVAAVFHDQLYKLRDSRGKAFADALFLAIMRYKGVSGWRRTAMYQSVVMYGQGKWDDDD